MLCPNKTPNIQTYWNISKYQATAQNIMASRSAVEGHCILQYSTISRNIAEYYRILGIMLSWGGAVHATRLPWTIGKYHGIRRNIAKSWSALVNRQVDWNSIEDRAMRWNGMDYCNIAVRFGGLSNTDYGAPWATSGVSWHSVAVHPRAR